MAVAPRVLRSNAVIYWTIFIPSSAQLPAKG
jgi:hypothetical protein